MKTKFGFCFMCLRLCQCLRQRKVFCLTVTVLSPKQCSGLYILAMTMTPDFAAACHKWTWHINDISVIFIHWNHGFGSHTICDMYDGVCLVFAVYFKKKLHFPDSKVHGANMGLTWVLSAPDGPHVGPKYLAIRVYSVLSVMRHHLLCSDYIILESLSLMGVSKTEMSPVVRIGFSSAFFNLLRYICKGAVLCGLINSKSIHFLPNIFVRSWISTQGWGYFIRHEINLTKRRQLLCITDTSVGVR